MKGGNELVEIMGVFRKPIHQDKSEKRSEEDIVAVRQRNVFGTSFHPELTDDIRIHVWWLRHVSDAARHKGLVADQQTRVGPGS